MVEIKCEEKIEKILGMKFGERRESFFFFFCLFLFIPLQQPATCHLIISPYLSYHCHVIHHIKTIQDALIIFS